MSYNYEKVSLSGNKNNQLIKETYLEQYIKWLKVRCI